MEKGRTVDLSGRVIEGTVWQMALGAGDIDPNCKANDPHHIDMCKMIESFFDKLPNSQDEKIKQYNEQFPTDYKPHAHEHYDFNKLITIILNDPCTNDQTNPMTRAALQAFIDQFTPKTSDTIKIGRHFDMQIFIDALIAYKNNWNMFSNWNQRSLYCREVLGTLQRLFPACYAQACRGLVNIVEYNKPVERALKLSDGSFYYASNPYEETGLGYSHFEYHGSTSTRGIGKWAASDFLRNIKKLHHSREKSFTELTHRILQPKWQTRLRMACCSIQ